MLLTPRAYLSTYMKIGTILFLALGVIIVNPTLEAPAFSQFIGGGGPIIPGPLFPFVFITIACGAISGFHALIATGTTSKMVDKESDIRPVGYMAMLFEGLVGVMALIAASALHPGDYFAINTSPAVFANLGMPMVNLLGSAGAGRRERHRPHRRRGVAGGRHGADLREHPRHARPDGLLVSLRDHVRGALHPDDDRLGHARRPLPAAGIVGRVWPKFGDTNWLPGALVSTGVMVLLWGYFIWTGSIDTIWPLFGVAQPAARVGGAGRRHDDAHQHRPREVRVGHVRAAVLPVGDDADGGFMSIRDNYWPKAIGADPALHVSGLRRRHLHG